jgi:hypothetical protein
MTTLWGKEWTGQAQKWFLFRFTGDESEINLAGDGTEVAEFSEWKWVPVEEVISNVCGFFTIIALRRKSTSLFSAQFENIIQHFKSCMIWNSEGCYLSGLISFSGTQVSGKVDVMSTFLKFPGSYATSVLIKLWHMQVVDFKKPVYERAFKHLIPLLNS